MEGKAQKSDNWGGKREGSGRKKTKAKFYGFNATPEVMAILEAVEGSKTDFINACILRACGKHGK